MTVDIGKAIDRETESNKSIAWPGQCCQMERHIIPIIVRLLLPCLLAGCASLPNVGYLRDRRALPAQAPAIVDTQGPLPAAARRA